MHCAAVSEETVLSSSIQRGRAAVDLWVCLFRMQTCALLTFMSLKCSDTERWSHWQRPAFTRRELLECGLQRANTKATCAVTRNKDMSEKINVTCDCEVLTLMLVY